MTKEEAVAALRAHQSAQLEKETMELVAKHVWMLPAPVRALLKKLAAFNDWHNLMEILK